MGGGPLGIMAGPPTPLPGPASPAGAYDPATYIALPIAWARPGPPAAPSPTYLAGCDGGASALIVMIFSPLSKTRPRARLISRSLSSGFFGFIFLYSSHDAKTRFICLSKAMKVPTNCLESVMVTRTL